jgi:hypothetical protein
MKADTAQEIATWGNNYPPSDFKWCYETLFRTKNGNWFLWGEGGAMSKYSRPCGNGTAGGREIIPLTNSEAFDWLASTDNIDVAEEYFPGEIEDA